MARAGSSEKVCFFFNDTATTEIYTLSLHDALPISGASPPGGWRRRRRKPPASATPRMLSRSPGDSRSFLPTAGSRSEEHTSELQSRQYLVCRLLLEKKKTNPSSSLFIVYSHILHAR